MLQKKSINFKRYGESVFITDKGWTSEVFSAFIQPLTYKNKMYMSGNYNEIGHYHENYCLYIGPPEVLLEKLSDKAMLTAADGRKYRIIRAERISVSGRPYYVWAVIKEYLER